MCSPKEQRRNLKIASKVACNAGWSWCNAPKQFDQIIRQNRLAAMGIDGKEIRAAFFCSAICWHRPLHSLGIGAWDAPYSCLCIIFSTSWISFRLISLSSSGLYGIVCASKQDKVLSKRVISVLFNPSNEGDVLLMVDT